MADYKYAGKTEEFGVVRYVDSAQIPNANGNKDWKEYQEYVTNGGLTDPFQTSLEVWEEGQKEKERVIRETYETDSTAPVTSGDETYNGGKTSSASIQWAVDLAEALGETQVTITDIDNYEVILTAAEATQVAADVGLSYRTAFYTKQEALVALAEEEFPG